MHLGISCLDPFAIEAVFPEGALLGLHVVAILAAGQTLEEMGAGGTWGGAYYQGICFGVALTAARGVTMF